MITAILHLIRVFVTGSYKRPREANGLVGLITLDFVFTGTVLKWDQEGVEASARSSTFCGSEPVAVTTPTAVDDHSRHFAPGAIDYPGQLCLAESASRALDGVKDRCVT